MKREHDALTFQLVRVPEELETSERHRIELEIALDVRLARIAELNGKIDQLREQKQTARPGE